MRPHQIENWALGVIERVEAGQPHEDFRVELKADWIEPVKAARRIAGHANAARGELILWIIGVDESEGARGVGPNDLASWYSEIKAEFDGPVPNLTDLNIPLADNKIIVVLLFETDRAPFVVKNPVHGNKDGGPVSLEVPWREGTAIRSAKHTDLIKLLTPLQYLPEIELLKGELSVSPTTDGEFQWHLSTELYIITKTANRIVIPFHWCECDVEILDCSDQKHLHDFRLAPLYRRGGFFRPEPVTSSEPVPLSRTIDATPTEVLISGPGFIKLTANVTTEAEDTECFSSDAKITIRLRPVLTDRTLLISTLLKSFGTTGPDDQSVWRWRLTDLS